MESGQGTVHFAKVKSLYPHRLIRGRNLSKPCIFASAIWFNRGCNLQGLRQEHLSYYFLAFLLNEQSHSGRAAVCGDFGSSFVVVKHFEEVLFLLNYLLEHSV